MFGWSSFVFMVSVIKIVHRNLFLAQTVSDISSLSHQYFNCKERDDKSQGEITAETFQVSDRSFIARTNWISGSFDHRVVTIRLISPVSRTEIIVSRWCHLVNTVI